MYRQEIHYLPAEPVVVHKPSYGAYALMGIGLIVVVIVIIVLSLFVCGCFVTCSTATAGTLENTAFQNNMPRVTAAVIGKATVLPVTGYITVNASSYEATSLEEVKSLSQEDCVKLCTDNKDCEGIKYSSELCTLFATIPDVKYTGSKPYEILQLKDDSRPRVMDRVFVGAQKSKLVNTQWWNTVDHDASGTINVFTDSKLKTWYLSSPKYDVINYGRMVGIYTNRKLSAAQIKDLLDKDIHPSGVTCVVDVPDKDIYSVDLSTFGRKSIFVLYVKHP
jgi:hypothetical protein